MALAESAAGRHLALRIDHQCLPHRHTFTGEFGDVDLVGDPHLKLAGRYARNGRAQLRCLRLLVARFGKERIERRPDGMASIRQIGRVPAAAPGAGLNEVGLQAVRLEP